MPRTAPLPRFAAVAITALVGSILIANPALAAETTLAAAPAAATPAPDQPRVIGLLANAKPDDQWGVPQRWGDGDIVLRYATRTTVGVTFPHVEGGSLEMEDVDLARADDQDLAVGTFPLGDSGELEVRDVAFDAAGTMTRFDALFRLRGDSPVNAYFGQLRFGQDEPAVRFSGTHLRWPQTPVGGTRVWVTQTVHNAGATPTRLGAATIAGRNAKDFALDDDRCSGTVLAAGTTCTVRVGFSPVHAGPRIAALRVPAGGSVLTADLSGQAPLGTTRLTVQGRNWIALGKTRTDADGPLVLYTQRLGESTAAFTPEATYVRGTYLSRLSVTAPDNGTLRDGTFRVGETGTGAALLGISRASRDCNGTEGTQTTSGLAFDDRGKVDRAKIVFSVDCGNDPYPEPVRGELLWRYRSDVTPPRGPAGVTISGTGTRTVTWSGSKSADAVATVVRLVEGDGTGATVLSGSAIAAGAPGSATLPALRPGQQYTVTAWSIDSAGNVSNAIRRSVTG